MVLFGWYEILRCKPDAKKKPPLTSDGLWGLREGRIIRFCTFIIEIILITVV
jgi:hypothetical protein